MACTTVEGFLSCLYPHQYWMYWSDTILSCWDPSTLSFWKLQITGIFWSSMNLFWCLSECFAFLPMQLVVSINPQLCYVSLTAMLCALRDLFHFGNPFLLSNCSLCFVSPLSGYLKGLSLSAFALFCHTDCLERPVCLAFSLSFLQIIDYTILFVRPLCFSPFLIPTSSSWLTYLHCSINSKLYSTLSTCPFVFPISIPPILSTSASLPHFLTPGRTTVRLKGGGGTRWLPTLPNCQTWCLPAVH